MTVVAASSELTFSSQAARATRSGWSAYHLFVRSTIIGEWLNGRRYPRTLPQAGAVLEERVRGDDVGFRRDIVSPAAAHRNRGRGVGAARHNEAC